MNPGKSVAVFALTALVAGLTACGGGGSPALVAASDVNKTFDAATGTATGGALVGTSLTFASGVAAFGTSASTTVAVAGSATAQTATISSGGNTANATMSYGSCIFKIATSNFADSSSLGVGKTVVVDPCSMTLTTKGLAANGGETLSRVSMQLGTASGSGSVRVTITPDGIVKVGSTQFANISLIPATGSGS